jgi:hypothetical protein
VHRPGYGPSSRPGAPPAAPGSSRPARRGTWASRWPGPIARPGRPTRRRAGRTCRCGGGPRGLGGRPRSPSSRSPPGTAAALRRSCRCPPCRPCRPARTTPPTSPAAHSRELWPGSSWSPAGGLPGQAPPLHARRCECPRRPSPSSCHPHDSFAAREKWVTGVRQRRTAQGRGTNPRLLSGHHAAPTGHSGDPGLSRTTDQIQGTRPVTTRVSPASPGPPSTRIPVTTFFTVSRARLRHAMRGPSPRKEIES